MEIVFFALLLVGIYFFMLYMPTSVLLGGKKSKKEDKESLLMFVAISLLMVLLTYLFANFYLLNASTGTVQCDSIANLSCLLHDRVNKVINPSLNLGVMLFIQIAISYGFTYYIAYQISSFKSGARRMLGITLFYATTLVMSMLHLMVLYEVAFTSGLKYVGLFVANAYVLMPLVYLVLLAYFNKDKLNDKQRI